MAFLYPDKEVEELFDVEIVEDVLLTQNKIESDLRGILAHIEDENYGKKVMDKYYSTSLNRAELAKVFFEACEKHDIRKRLDDSLVGFDSDMVQAFNLFLHFQFPPFSEVVMGDNKLGENDSARLRKKYIAYNKHVMPYYDFFKKSNKEKLRLIFGNVKKELAPRRNLDQKDYDALKLIDIAAVTIASYGAMGEPGVMTIVTKYMEALAIDIQSYIDMGNKFGLAEIFDAYGVPPMRLMQEGEMNLGHWYAFYMGFGNVLLIAKKYYPKANEYILDRLGKKWSCVELYGKRAKLIEYAILNTED